MNAKKNRKLYLILIALIFLITLYFIYLIRSAILPFVFAAVLVYLIEPLVNRLENKGFSRQQSLLFILGIVFILITALLLYLLPRVIDQLHRFAIQLPVYLESLQNLDGFLTRRLDRIGLPDFLDNLLVDFNENLEQMFLEFVNNLTGSILNSVSLVVAIVLSPFISYYLLRDLEEIKLLAFNMIPEEKRSFVLMIAEKLNEILSGFLRGQFLVATSVAILSIISLTIIKLKFALLIGLLAGFLNIIPFFGPIISSIPAIAIGLTESFSKALLTAGVFIIIQQLESTLISPLIMSDKVGLHPLTIIFALLAGSELAGITGLILAIPVVGILKFVFQLSLVAFTDST